MDLAPGKTAGTRDASLDADRENFEIRARILQVVYAALDDLPFDKVSVSLICERAGISRPTFYRYFTDRNDVCNWFIRTTMRSSLNQIGIVFSWQEGLVRFCRVMDANCDLAAAFLADRRPFSPYDLLMTALEDVLIANALTRGADGDDREIAFQARGFSRAFAGALVDWLAEGGSVGIPIERFAELSCALAPRRLFDLLDAPTAGGAYSEAFRRAADRTPLIEFVPEPTR